MRDYIRQLRSKVGNDKIIVPGVRTLVFNSRGEVLLQKQKLFGSWSLPHGCVDLGESAEEAARRETLEETGIAIGDVELFGIYTHPRYSVSYPNGDEVQTFTMAFLVHSWEGTPRPDHEEVDAVAFFSPDALPEPFYEIHRETIEDYLRSPGKVVVK